MFWKKRKGETSKKRETSKTYTGPEIMDIIDNIASRLDLKEGEKVVGALPIHIGVREDFDPTHSFSCGSVRDKVKMWRLGAFIQTSERLIFKRLEDDETSTTILNIPLEAVYTVEVSGVEEKQLEICCDAGSFEFKGFDKEGIYKISEALQYLSDYARQAKREALYPATVVTICKYCGARNKGDATYCVNCGALVK
jgi:ribosomal protein L40E